MNGNGRPKPVSEEILHTLAKIQGPQSAVARALADVARKRAAQEDVEILVDEKNNFYVRPRDARRGARAAYVSAIFVVLLGALFTLAFFALTAILPNVAEYVLAVALVVGFTAIMVLWTGQYALTSALERFLFEDSKK